MRADLAVDTLTIIMPLVVLLPGLVILAMAFRAFNALVTVQRARHPEAWERDGRPQPFYAAHHNATRSWKSGFATQRCSFVGLFKTPPWVATDTDALHSLRRLRLFVGLWNLVAIPAFVVSIYIAVLRN
jgi:hypothetical protein